MLGRVQCSFRASIKDLSKNNLDIERHIFGELQPGQLAKDPQPCSAGVSQPRKFFTIAKSWACWIGLTK